MNTRPIRATFGEGWYERPTMRCEAAENINECRHSSAISVMANRNSGEWAATARWSRMTNCCNIISNQTPMVITEAISCRVSRTRWSSVSSSQYRVPYSADHSGLHPCLSGSRVAVQSISVIALREASSEESTRRRDTSSIPSSIRLGTPSTVVVIIAPIAHSAIG